MTEQEAIALAQSEWWATVSDLEIVVFQLYEDRLCMPFDRFHEAMQSVLGRPVWTHEFAWPELLRDELLTLRDAPSMADIIGQLPQDKTIIVMAKPEEEE